MKKSILLVLAIAATQVASAATVTASDSSTLVSAISGASAGDTVQLSADISITATITLNKDITIDLNGHTLTGEGCRVFLVQNGTVNLAGTGTIQVPATTAGSMANSGSVIRVGDNTAGATPTLNVGSGVTVTTDYCYAVSIFGKSGHKTLNVNGTVSATGPWNAISGTGNLNEGDTEINICPGATVSASNDYAIYHPQGGTLAVNGTVTGGIEAKSGTVTIGTGAAVTARDVTPGHTMNNNGTSTQGYAVAVVDNSNYAGGTATLSITGGTITGPLLKTEDNETVTSGELAISGGIYTVDPSAYLAPGAYYDSTGGTVTGSEVAATGNEFGLLRVDSALTDTIVAVPWVRLSGGAEELNTVVSNLVKTANLTEGDRLYAFQDASGLYEAWELRNNVWAAIGTVDVASGTVQNATPAAERPIAPGGAFWLHRQNPTNNGTPVPFYLFGQVSDAAVATAVTAGTAEAPVWNLVANAGDAPFALNPAATGVGASDEIYLVSEGAPTKYTLKNGVWGSIVVQTVDGRTVRRWTAADVTISKGTGFWYVSKGGSPTFNW